MAKTLYEGPPDRCPSQRCERSPLHENSRKRCSREFIASNRINESRRSQPACAAGMGLTTNSHTLLSLLQPQTLSTETPYKYCPLRNLGELPNFSLPCCRLCVCVSTAKHGRTTLRGHDCSVVRCMKEPCISTEPPRVALAAFRHAAGSSRSLY